MAETVEAPTGIYLLDINELKPTPLLDWRGTPIKLGDHIVYPGRISSSLWMVEAEVVDIEWTEPRRRYVRHDNGEWGPVEKREPVLVVDRVRDGSWGTVNRKRARVSSLNRVTVVS